MPTATTQARMRPTLGMSSAVLCSEQAVEELKRDWQSEIRQGPNPSGEPVETARDDGVPSCGASSRNERNRLGTRREARMSASCWSSESAGVP